MGKLSEQLRLMAESAAKAAGQGRWQEAESLWHRVLQQAPNHPQALYSLGVHAYRRGQLDEALRLLQAALQTGADPVILLTLAVVLRERGDILGEAQAIDRALSLDPYFLPGLLAKASIAERQARPRAAAAIYRDALKIAPPQPQWPAALRPQLERARELVERSSLEFTEFLQQRMGQPMQKLSAFEAARWLEVGAVMAGRSRVFPSVCNTLQVSRLPAIPFFDREQFEWVAALEEQTEAITAELQEAMSAQSQAFQPYVAYPDGAPVNQWHELNHSKRWSSYFLWRNGMPQAAHLAQCPKTAAALRAVEMADIGGLCPNAMFSALAPKTVIPPHHGETNARLVVHLPLIVPEHCRYRVGFEHRSWRRGEVLIFDDSIEHEARNDSDELRVVLIFDVWNPLLSTAEREMVRVLSDANSEFHSDSPK